MSFTVKFYRFPENTSSFRQW